MAHADAVVDATAAVLGAHPVGDFEESHPLHPDGHVVGLPRSVVPTVIIVFSGTRLVIKVVGHTRHREW